VSLECLRRAQGEPPPRSAGRRPAAGVRLKRCKELNNKVFEKLIRFWRQRKNSTEALSPQEIAFHLFGKGSPDNVTKTLHILWEFKAYFYLPSTNGKKGGSKEARAKLSNLPNLHQFADHSC
jgi:hypothetical protein